MWEVDESRSRTKAAQRLQTRLQTAVEPRTRDGRLPQRGLQSTAQTGRLPTRVWGEERSRRRGTGTDRSGRAQVRTAAREHGGVGWGVGSGGSGQGAALRNTYVKR